MYYCLLFTGFSNSTAVASIENNVVTTRAFQILYRNEDINLCDAVLYRIHTLVDSSRLEENLESLGLQLVIELWFSEEEDGYVLGTSHYGKPDSHYPI